MTIRIALNHRTEYAYDRPVGLSPHVFRLRPAVHSRTPVEAYSLKIEPTDHFINWQQDPFGNWLARVVFLKTGIRRLRVEVDLVASLTVINPFDFFVEEYAETAPFAYDRQLRRELVPYLERVEDGPLLREKLGRVDRTRRRTVDFLVDVNRELCAEIGYTIRLEPGIQTCEQTLERGLGSCRDSAWLLVQMLRHLGFATRFVSGYLVQLKADEKALDGPSGPEADFTDLHAWAEVYVPGAGWLGLDPTSGLFAGEGHIPLACTPDPVSAAPITGATDPCEARFTYANTVRRIHEDPRVTKPYPEYQWEAIQALGRRVDQSLEAANVRLSMGGEPTFVSIDDMESAQWNTAADGPEKRRLAGDLANRLLTAFAPGGTLHFGQGKWYPGEPLPRWQITCFWRADGVPVWRDPGLCAADPRAGSATADDAERFIRALAACLKVDPAHVRAGYEDAVHYLMAEGNLPVNVDPLAADLDDPLERRRLAAVLQRGLGKPVGYVLPLGWVGPARAWRSCPWEFRRGHLFLMPGDSPMGLRLPLESLPWEASEKREPAEAPSTFDPPLAMDDYPAAVRETGRPEKTTPQKPVDPAGPEGPGSVLHTALCVEPREGRLNVFLPPTPFLERYLQLVAAVEKTAADLSIPVRLEGYEPPQDPRIRQIRITPDPGVIEVNIHPAVGWEDLEHNTLLLYEQARLARLGTEKFMLDGRHTGTGGGNHITIGGATPADSPMLRRPDLLRSLITFWQHHPGLSYLFSGMFIGPTSQAPRVDEGRSEHLYEMEIAFGQMPEGQVDRPWLVDRLLRNLLVDITGNTHRAEFCIDKLYPPESLGRRLGLVELRAFDMPPHSRMSLAQMLLVRCLIARFWEAPYAHRLVRWGTELHDRFMLPHYVWTDLEQVTDDLKRAGFDYRMAWLDPFFEFRFPHYGSVRYRDISLELRMAIEPWHVLGEEVTHAGTSRFVDSSVERLQVKVQGLTDSRHVVACNGRRLPLTSTGTHGEYVCGVRYQAWQPPSALHPTIGVHTPLVLDVVDTWNGRSIGGCTYHVGHPGGRGYDVFPVNAFEAEARRISRFWNYGHTPAPPAPLPAVAEPGRFVPAGSPPGPMKPPRAEVNPEYPFTLDLRRSSGPTL